MRQGGRGQDGERLARLSAGQRTCLMLVADGCTSKEIAKRLGISPHTVDQRLRLAIQALGVANRFEAARLFRDAEQPAAPAAAPPPPPAPTYQSGSDGSYQSIVAPPEHRAPAAAEPYQRVAYQAPQIASAAAPPLVKAVSDQADDTGEPGPASDRRNVFGEARAAFTRLEADLPAEPAAADPNERGRRNELSPGARIGWTTGLVIGLILALSLLVMVAEGLARILRLGGA